MDTSKKNNNIKSVVKAISIIELLVSNGKAISLTEMARELGMARSTVHGLASTLLDLGYLSQNPETGHYELGTKLYEVGNAVASNWTEKSIAKPYITYLVEKLKETVHMAKLSDGKVLYIDKYESTHSIRIVTETGLKLPAHCTGVGKVLLAYLSKAELDYILKTNPLEYYTDKTITNRQEFDVELEKIRKQGYATDNQEFVAGLACVAAPIFNHQNTVIAALSISAPVSRMKTDYMEMIKDDLLKACQEISIKLGSTIYE